MKKILFVLSILLLAASCGNETPTTPTPPASKYQKYAKEGEIKIMSFNVRTNTSKDTGINAWDSRKEACVALIKDQKPTIIGFQEAQYTSQWLYLKNQLAADYDGYGLNRTTGKESGTGETMGILYDRSLVKKIEVGTFWLSEKPDVAGSTGWGASMPRTATWGLFEYIPTGEQFFYINTHLDHESETAQVEGMKLIDQKFKEYKGECPLFLTGDLNVVSTHQALDVIKDYMRNARTYANRTDSYGTVNSFESDTKTKKIDHIYYSKELKAVEYHTIKEVYDNVKFVSDHYPIYAIIKL